MCVKTDSVAKLDTFLSINNNLGQFLLPSLLKNSFSRENKVWIYYKIELFLPFLQKNLRKSLHFNKKIVLL